MYHPTRGGVRGGRDQFSWDDVKVDKHRENYLGHSVKAPVGRWQKGKDLNWYARDKRGGSSNEDALKEEIKRIKEEEEQAMREALGLAPKSSTRPQGNRLDKHELSELVKRGSTAEDVGSGHAEAAWVHGVGFAKAPRPWEDPKSLPSFEKEEDPPVVSKTVGNEPIDSEGDEKKGKPEKREKQDRHERREKRKRHEKTHSRDSDGRKKREKDKGGRKHKRHGSDSG
ncbi:PREDICTED: multiple myeloma tumor-associated protein 2 homolog [Tarenaya hassleriana]|uniref:multiple myeloma tumor-associated protein 2 homolog n=1 Tax=Tarenaya hassleriana TaxID=28532 RepID=UPI00053C9773|nr:PREDICTED: multiple myeloma tumor-associated protein 2 homolog [Tarenaya hassleriana]